MEEALKNTEGKVVQYLEGMQFDGPISKEDAEIMAKFIFTEIRNDISNELQGEV